jgi:hypothetical protein
VKDIEENHEQTDKREPTDQQAIDYAKEQCMTVPYKSALEKLADLREELLKDQNQ